MLKIGIKRKARELNKIVYSPSGASFAKRYNIRSKRKYITTLELAFSKEVCTTARFMVQIFNYQQTTNGRLFLCFQF